MGLIFVTTLCLISGSLLTTAEEGPLCREKEREFQVLSLINLVKETIIHTIDQNGEIDFWRVNGAYSKLNQSDYDIKIVPEVTESHYSDSGLSERLSLKQTALNLNLDIKQQIIAYVIPIVNDLQSECNTTANTLPKSSCDTLWAMTNNSKRLRYFICIAGVNSLLQENDTKVAIYESYHELAYPISGIIELVSDWRLYGKVYPYCRDEPDHKIEVNGISFSNWEYSTDEWHNTTILAFKGIDNTLTVVSKIRLKGMSFVSIVECIHYMSESEGWFVFRFNQYYEHMFCGKNCTLDSNLLWIEYGIDNLHCTAFVRANLTLRRLLGCDGRDNPLEQPIVPPVVHKPTVPPITKPPKPSFDLTIEAQKGSLCEALEWGYDILSIFSLAQITIFHIKKQTTRNVYVNFYRIEADNKSDSDMSIPQTFTEHNDLVLKDLLNYFLELEEPIVGIILPMWDKYCSKPNTEIICGILSNKSENFDSKYVVCFVGVHKSHRKLTSYPLLFDAKNYSFVNLISSSKLIDIYYKALPYCESESEMVQTTQGNMPVLSRLTLSNITNITVHHHGNITIVRTLDNQSKLLESEQYFGEEYVWFVFSFNGNYQFLFCGRYCNLNTPLLWMVIGREGILKEPVTVDFLTLRKLLRCDARDDYLLKIAERLEDKSDPKTIIHDINNEGPLCKAEDTDFKIISIFSLVDETFIHTKDRNGKIEIWRIWGAYNTLPENDNIIPFNVTEKHYSDDRMINYLSVEFDLENQIMPYVLPVYEYLQTECSQLQPKSPPDPFGLTNISCNVLDDYYNKDIYFVCIKGADWDTRIAKRVLVTYDKISHQFKYIHDLGLFGKVNPFCKNDNLLKDRVAPDRSGVVAYSSWGYQTNPYLLGNISVIHNNNYNKVMVRMNVNGEEYNFEDSKLIEVYPNVWFVFRINTYYKHLFCVKKCTLDTTLFWRNYTIENGKLNISDVRHPKARLTIRKLLGCKTKAIPFEPNKFCDTNEKFLSFFNLGEDLYFQRSGRFWRYRPPKGEYNLFTNDANPNIKTKIGSIRYESGVTELLSKTFETSLPIVGFTFRMYEIDLCLPYEGKSAECVDKYYRSRQHLRTCIYGYTEDIVNPNQTKFTASTFMYSSSGMRPFRTDEKGLPLSIEIETRNYCEFLYTELRKFGVNLTEYNLTSTVNPGSYEGYNKAFNVVLFVLSHIRIPNKYRVFVIKWSCNQTLPRETRHGLENVREYWVRELESRYLGVSIFLTIGANKWGFRGDMNEPLKQVGVGGMGDVIAFEHYYISVRRTEKKLFDLVGCPVNTTTSLVTVGHRETPCQYNRSTDTESIFMVAGTLYHQVGQYFHKYDKLKRKFLYDKYMSELLNQYFDTTYRVIGYSLEDSVHKDRHKVIIHGRSHYQFRDYDKFLFAAFHINSSDPFSELSAVNNPNNFDQRISSTLGVHHWTKSHDRNERIFILAIHRRLNEPDQKTHIPLLTIISKLVPSFTEVAFKRKTNRSEFDIYVTNDPNEEMFAFKGKTHDKWKEYVYEHKDMRGEVLGIAEFDNGFQTMVFNQNPTRTFYTLGTREKGFWLQLTFDYRAQYCNNVSEFRCEPNERGDKPNCNPLYHEHRGWQGIPLASKSESSPKILYKCLAFVVLVLLITALIVGFIVSYNTQKYFKEPKNPKVDTSQPNQPNDTVVRHPESKPVESESKESSLERTVRSDEI